MIQTYTDPQPSCDDCDPNKELCPILSEKFLNPGYLSFLEFNQINAGQPQPVSTANRIDLGLHLLIQAPRADYSDILSAGNIDEAAVEIPWAAAQSYLSLKLVGVIESCHWISYKFLVLYAPTQIRQSEPRLMLVLDLVLKPA